MHASSSLSVKCETPDEFARYINADVAKWSTLVTEQNITIPGAAK